VNDCVFVSMMSNCNHVKHFSTSAEMKEKQGKLNAIVSPHSVWHS